MTIAITITVLSLAVLAVSYFLRRSADRLLVDAREHRQRAAELLDRTQQYLAECRVKYGHEPVYANPNLICEN